MSTRMIRGEELAPPERRLALAARHRAFMAGQGVPSQLRYESLDDQVVTAVVRHRIPVITVAKYYEIPKATVLAILTGNRVPIELTKRKRRCEA